MRTYTQVEANAVLPQVRALVERIAALVPALPEMEEAVRTARFMAQRGVAGPADVRRADDAEEALRAAEMALAVAAGTLDAMDVVVKDAASGLVDFLSVRNGEMVELCWRLGEPSVAHWHRPGEGFAGRQAL
ncbi:MAG: DUF2203 family protein [Candidatus Dormibacteria bacterium]